MKWLQDRHFGGILKKPADAGVTIKTWFVLHQYVFQEKNGQAEVDDHS